MATRREIFKRIIQEFLDKFPQAKVFLRSNSLRVYAGVQSNISYDLDQKLEEIKLQLSPQTSSVNILLNQGALFGVYLLAASPSRGYALIEGTIGTIIPLDTTFNIYSLSFKTLSAATIKATALKVVSITREGETATVTTAERHGLSTGVTATIDGANETEYNISATVTIASEYQFTYQITGTPNTPATGNITVSYNAAILDLQCTTIGVDSNVEPDAELSIETPIPNVDTTAYADYFGMTGGNDGEKIEGEGEFRERVVEAWGNPASHFNDADIIKKAKEVRGVTKVWVERITPEAGDTTVYFARFNDETPIPTPSEVQTVYEKLLTILPANMDDDQLHVLAPTERLINFEFTGITPDTPTMLEAIKNNLELFLTKNSNVSKNINVDAYRSAIYSTVDLTNGQQLQSFSLQDPVGDIPISESELGVLGLVKKYIPTIP